MHILQITTATAHLSVRVNVWELCINGSEKNWYGLDVVVIGGIPFWPLVSLRMDSWPVLAKMCPTEICNLNKCCVQRNMWRLLKFFSPNIFFSFFYKSCFCFRFSHKTPEFLSIYDKKIHSENCIKTVGVF